MSTALPGVLREAAPTAADILHALPRFQSTGVDREIQLAALRRLQPASLAAGIEIGLYLLQGPSQKTETIVR